MGGTRVLDATMTDPIGSLGDASSRLVLQLMASDAVLSWSQDTKFMQLSEDGRLATKIAGGPCGWGSVFGSEPLPREGRCCWKLIVRNVGACGDIIIGLLNPDSKETFCFVAVGAPSGMLGINSNECQFGPSTTGYMRWTKRDYCQMYSYDAPNTVGLEITALWCHGALSFALNGQGLGVAFKFGDREHDRPLASGDKFIPFVTCYASSTAVMLDPRPDCDAVRLDVVESGGEA